MAGGTCIEQLTDLRNTFRCSDAPVHSTSCMFGDNESVINGSAFPCAPSHKRHNTPSHHHVRSQIARGCTAMHHIRSHNNVADVASKHWSCSAVANFLEPMFHHIGNAVTFFKNNGPDYLDSKIKCKEKGISNVTARANTDLH